MTIFPTKKKTSKLEQTNIFFLHKNDASRKKKKLLTNKTKFLTLKYYFWRTKIFMKNNSEQLKATKWSEKNKEILLFESFELETR